MPPNGHAEKCCWVTLITKDSYLPGAIILAYTLDQHSSRFPLIVQYTSSLGAKAIQALEEEGRNHGRIIPQEVELLLPRGGQENKGSVAERFKDTFTKLRAFEVYKQGYTKAIFLDADMAIFRDPDEAFETELPGRDWIGANHTCCCNLDHDSWAPKEWHKGNCPYTTLVDPTGIVKQMTSESRPTYHLINGGMFLFYPSEKSWNDLLAHFNTTENLKNYQFPDQDFLAEYYRLKWQPLSWKYNAIKTMKYWHPNMWSDEDLVVLHYIVDKPWERQVSANGIGGHLGRDGVTHSWWWRLFYLWRIQRKADGRDKVVVSVMNKLINTKPPFTKMTPLSQDPGTPEDIKPWP